MLRGRDSSCSSREPPLRHLSKTCSVDHQEIAASTHITTFEEGFGRFMYVAGAFENERPFFAPLCKFPLTPLHPLHPRGSVCPVSPLVCFILRRLQPRLRRCGTSRAHLTLTRPRRRAESTQTSETRTGIGGWLGVLDRHDIPAPKTNLRGLVRRALVRNGHGSLRRAIVQRSSSQHWKPLQLWLP